MYYVYAHTKPSGEIFYIGKGTKRRVRDVKNRNNHWNNIKNAHGFIPVILAEFEDEQKALDEESILIAHFRKFGTIVNVLDSGEVNPMSNPEIAQKVAKTKREKGQYDGRSLKSINDNHHKRMKTDPQYAMMVSSNRKKAQSAALLSRIEKMRPIVLEIRQLRKEGWLLKELSAKFNMQESTISNIVNGRCYASIS